MIIREQYLSMEEKSVNTRSENTNVSLNNISKMAQEVIVCIYYVPFFNCR